MSVSSLKEKSDCKASLKFNERVSVTSRCFNVCLDIEERIYLYKKLLVFTFASYFFSDLIIKN